MASTGDEDGSEVGSSVDAWAENIDIDLEEAQRDSSNTAPPVHAHTDNERQSQDEDSSEDDRENRFQGPSSTWRFFTEEERTLVYSLDQQRANDLSLHLYNTHALKAGLRNPEAANVAHHRSKKRWIKPNQNGHLPWQPPDRWTAWPLAPEKVPRSSEKFGVSVVLHDLEDATSKKAKPWRPSGELREEILAVTLKRAKEKLPANDTRDTKRASDASNKKPPDDEDAQMSEALPSDADVSMDEDTDVDDNFVSSGPYRSNRSKSMAASTSIESIILDDDEARSLLQPRINHVLTQLDGLLIGLRKSRAGPIRTNSRSQSRSGRSRSTSRPAKATSRSKSRRRKDEDDQDDEVAADAQDADFGSQGNSTRSRRQRKLKPRDWSEVLGMAAFTGWDPRVVDRAAKRCTALFGERMDFRSVPLNLITSTKSSIRPHGAAARRDDDAVAEEDFIVDDKPGGSKAKGYVCPVDTCARHKVPFDKTWRWREHLKRSHKWTSARTEKLEAGLGDGAERIVAGAGATTAGKKKLDTILRPIDVKMARGKDLGPRKRKASQPEPITIEDDEAPIEIDSDSDSESESESDEDTDMEEEQ